MLDIPNNLYFFPPGGLFCQQWIWGQRSCDAHGQIVHRKLWHHINEVFCARNLTLMTEKRIEAIFRYGLFLIIEIESKT